MLYAAGSYYDLTVESAAPCGLTWNGSLLWFADSGREQVVGIDPHSGEQLVVVPAPGLRNGLAASAGHLVYVAGTGGDDQQICILDVSTGRVVDRVPNPRPGRDIRGLESGRPGLWIVYRDLLDWRAPDFQLTDSLAATRTVSGVTVTDRFIVYCSHPDRPLRVPMGTIVIVDPAERDEVLGINVHGTPTGLAWDGSRIWYCDYATSRLRAIDVPGIVR